MELASCWVYISVRHGMQVMSTPIDVGIFLNEVDSCRADAHIALAKTTYGHRGSASSWSDLHGSGGST